MGKKSPSQNITNDSMSPALVKLRNEIIRENIKPVEFAMIPQIDLNYPLNKPFSAKKFHTALRQSKTKSAPGIDRFTFEIIKKLPSNQLDTVRG